MLQPSTPPQPWELDRLPREALEATYSQLVDFVDWLRTMGLRVPPCWYLHRHLVHRLAAIAWWRVQAYQDTTSPKGEAVPAEPQDAAQWWASPSGLDGWLRLCQDDRIGECQGEMTWHSPKGGPDPTLEDAVRQHLAAVTPQR